MILNLFRKIFGCYSCDQLPVIDLAEQEENHTSVQLCTCQKKAISEIVGSVLAVKERGFVSWVEDAMDGVTENRFKPLPYRNTAKKARKSRRGK